MGLGFRVWGLGFVVNECKLVTWSITLAAKSVVELGPDTWGENNPNVRALIINIGFWGCSFLQFLYNIPQPQQGLGFRA